MLFKPGSYSLTYMYLLMRTIAAGCSINKISQLQNLFDFIFVFKKTSAIASLNLNRKCHAYNSCRDPAVALK
ncbi:MAG: hypothetical protein V7K97_04930 [Nostoc sp.]|uniref:hypothetical protein n=1 Tax=Nostoc sp. TaxID=1180 RepID=UPI002FFCF808